MFRDNQKFEQLWLGVRSLSDKLKKMDTSKDKGTLFESECRLLINDIYDIPVGGGTELVPCRGVNAHQFDVVFEYEGILHLGECKYSEQDDNGAWAYIKEGNRKFAFAAFQRAQYLQTIGDYRQIRLVLITNRELNKTILNDCVFNNMVFLNPYQPYISLALHLFKKRKKSLKKFYNETLYGNLESYQNVLFRYPPVARNTRLLPKEIVDDYLTFLHDNNLSYKGRADEF
ncbi:MAG: hypothetical protein K0Q50_2081 [Vampirovibrio sp.]|jgi:hypothetical protein|nr:hypothetical protein [Vampirovibrio sp.]